MNAPALVKKEREREKTGANLPAPSILRTREYFARAARDRDAKGSDKSKRKPTIDVSRNK